jgi:hypothetical protein
VLDGQWQAQPLTQSCLLMPLGHRPFHLARLQQLSLPQLQPTRMCSPGHCCRANYNAEQQRKEEEAQRAAARRRQKAAAAAAAAAAEQAGAEGQQRGRSREVKAVSTAASLAGRSKQAAAA